MRLPILLLTSALAFGAAAQTPKQVQLQHTKASTRNVAIGSGEVDTAAQRRLIDRFYEDQFRHEQDPRLPYFQLMSRDGLLAMGIGGDIQALAQYDWHGSIDGSDFSPAEIAIPANHAAVNRLQTTMGQSSLFINVMGTNHVIGDFQVYVQAKFSGSGNAFVLKKAYAIVGDFTGGLATSTFCDPAAQPSTVETEGPNSEISYSRWLLRYMHTFKGNVTMAVSAEAPNFNIPSATANYAPGSAYMPTFAGFVQYGTRSEHIRLSGVVKGMRYRNLVEKKNAYCTGWGISLTTVFAPWSPLTVMAGVQGGEGLGNMVNDLSCFNSDLLGLASKPGKMYAPKSYGWYAALQYNFRPNLFSTLVFSQERMLPRHGSVYAESAYKYGLYGTANIFWSITPRLQVGGEVNVGKKMEMDGSHRMAYRANLMAQFSF